MRRATLLLSLAAVIPLIACSDGSIVSVEVVVPAEPPLVDAGPDLSVAPGDEVLLEGAAEDASGSSEMVIVAWTQISGPEVELTGADTLTCAFVAPSEDEALILLGFELRVTSAEGAISADIASVTVVRVDEPPTAEAGPDQQVDEQTAVVLEGSGSDPEGGQIDLSWSQASGPEVELSDDGAGTAVFEAPSRIDPAVLVFRLDAVDEAGLTATDHAVVTVLPVNDPPTADAGPDLERDEQTEVTIEGAASDPDGSVASTSWTQLQGPTVPLTGEDSLTLEFVTPALVEVEVLLFQLTVTDDEGAAAVDLVTVLVLPVNASPTALAGPDQIVTEGDVVTMAGSASDPDGVVVTTTWTQLSGLSVTLSAPDVLAPTSDAPDVTLAEELLFELLVVDDEGASASDQVLVTVEPLIGENLPPSAYAGPDQSVEDSVTVTLAGIGTDADGVVVAYEWTQLEGPVVVLTGSTTDTATFVAPADPGCAVNLVFELTVTDDDGATDTDSAAVAISDLLSDIISVGTLLDLELDDGGLTTAGALWEYGVPVSGPSAVWDGTRGWATQLGGGYPHNSEQWLCLPAVELAGEPEATLTFRLWASSGGGDGVTLEALDPTNGWTVVVDVEPPYDATTVGGLPAWGDHGYKSGYVLAGAAIPAWAGDPAFLRLAFRSDAFYGGQGAYIDEVRVDSEADDPDGDGLVGILDELYGFGTDPFEWDTDGDGTGDGEEILVGTEPLDPADHPGATALLPGDLLDFEGDDGGLATDRTVWQRGVPTTGPGAAWSGAEVWATNLTGNYGNNDREYLYLPPLDLTTAVEPTLGFRFWSRGAGGDGISLEYLEPTSGVWLLLPSVEPAYDGTDAIGQPAWRNFGYLSNWTWAAASLNAHVGGVLLTRLALRSDWLYAAAGAYIDDLVLLEESDDLDGDGIPGILNELAAAGSDPWAADTDGDGALDGDELAAGTGVDDPAWYPGGPMLVPGDVLDFEGSGDGLATTGTLWAHGTPGNGPGGAWSGTGAWATSLAGNYFHNAIEHLYLPPLDLTGTTDPTFSMRLRAIASANDGLTLEVLDPVGGWTVVLADQPAHDGTNALGQSAWNSQGYRSEWVLAVASLQPWAGLLLPARLSFRSDWLYAGAGMYIDDVALAEESADPDGDGLPGILDEFILYGSDPYLADTDGDGADDGDEVAAGTDPTDPAWYPGGPMLVPGTYFDLETDDGGLATTRSRWEYGIPASGPGAAHSGSRAWATNLAGAYSSDDIEWVHLPPADLTAAVEPTLSFRLWHGASGADGTSLQILDPAAGWLGLVPDTPDYDGTNAIGEPAWINQQTPTGGYVLAAVDLSPWVGDVVQLRLLQRTDWLFGGSGAYVDDFALDEESDDPDGDGLPGVLDEYLVYGTDPYLADTDGDGVDDGAEIAAGTDPLL